jgi:hypothetical protein
MANTSLLLLLAAAAAICAPVAVDEHCIWTAGQPLHCPLHGQHGCLQDVDLINGFAVNDGTAAPGHSSNMNRGNDSVSE